LRSVWLLLVVAVFGVGMAGCSKFAVNGHCSEDDWETVQAKVEPLLQRFQDSYTLAGQTPRVSLPPVISDLQGTRRDYDNLHVPSCYKDADQLTRKAMDDSINVLLSFLGQDPTVRTSVANDDWDSVATAVAGVKPVAPTFGRQAPPAGTNMPSPASTPEPHGGAAQVLPLHASGSGNGETANFTVPGDRVSICWMGDPDATYFLHPSSDSRTYAGTFNLAKKPGCSSAVDLPAGNYYLQIVASPATSWDVTVNSASPAGN
jgi:hypothetical protein